MLGIPGRLNALFRPNGHVFYGWYIVGAAAGIQFLGAFLWMQSFGAYVVLLQDEFGWSKALVAGGFALTRVESGILGPLQGWLVDKYGPRWILSIGMVLFGIGFMAFSRVGSLLEFYLAFTLIALGSSLGGFATVTVSLVNWFSRNRAKAIAISQMGYSFGGFCVPLLILCLEGFGWRETALYSGFLVLLIGIPMVQMVRHRPQDHGEVVDGGVVNIDREPTSVFPIGLGFTARQAMRTSSFWLISLGHACALLAVSSVLVHLVPHLTEGMDFTLAQAGLVVALMTGFQMAGQLIGGFLGDRFNKQLICVLCMVAHTLTLGLLAYASSLWAIIVFTALHGLAWGIRGPLMVALRADYFGLTSFGTIMGFSSLIVMLGMSGGPIYAGYMADVYGDYKIAFSTIAVGALLGSFCFALARPPSRPDT
ncbi:MAG: MFS transporter [Gammaproteobacteria bacterium]|nr:MFS transporter [Gammaproteobacteria bacterium]